MTAPLQDAINRGKEAGERLIHHRDAVIEHAVAILLIAGKDGMRACLAGAGEAAIIALEKRARGEGEP